MWIATLTTGEGLKRRAFSVSAHGEDGARNKAIAQRQMWLAELSPRHHAMCDTSRAAAAHHDAPLPAPSLDPVPNITPDEIAARVAVIDARIDADMPRRLRWRVRAQTAAKPDGPLTVLFSDAGLPARRQTRTICPRWRHLTEMLAEAIYRLRDGVADIHGDAVADWFIRNHAKPTLTPERFKPAIGIMDCVIVPGDGRQLSPMETQAEVNVSRLCFS